MNDRGFTMLEFLIAGLLTILVVAAATLGVREALNISSQSKTQGEVEGDTLAALQHIRRVGRVARSCEKKGTAPDFFLECVVDANVPSNGALASVRFIRVGNQLEFQRLSAPTGGTWENKASYPNIASFVICNDADMDLPTGNCPLLPLQLSKANTLNNSVARANRFYRFGLVGTAASNLRNVKVSYQSAFYVRNPSTLGANVFFQFGG